MSKKIKSITTETGETFNSKDWELTLQEDNYIKAKFKGKSKQTVWYPKDTLVIEYESKILKRPDGSVISEPEEGVEICFINEYFVIIFCNYKNYMHLKNGLKQGLIFLPEDKHLAEKKAKMLNKRRDIKYEIDRLNAEDTEEKNQMFWFLIGSKKVTYVYMNESERINNPNKLISKETAETILAKYSQDELKQYLGIII